MSSLVQLSVGGVGTDVAAFLLYPRHYFGSKGNIPENREDTKPFWPFRKDKPKVGDLDDQIPFNGFDMQLEMNALCRSLREHVREQFSAAIRRAAKKLVTLQMKETNQDPVRNNDIRKCASELSDDDNGHVIVYKIFHRFHRDRNWLTNDIDRWFEKQGIALADVVPAP